MRPLPLLVLLAACSPGPVAEDDIVPPDAFNYGCTGEYTIEAPRANLHYSPHLDVYLEHAEVLVDDLTWTMVDGQGATYAWTTDTPEPQADAGVFYLDKVHYELAPSRHYTLTLTDSCSTFEPQQTVEFFTSAE
jgi:hypothetical protein